MPSTRFPRASGSNEVSPGSQILLQKKKLQHLPNSKHTGPATKPGLNKNPKKVYLSDGNVIGKQTGAQNDKEGWPSGP